MIDNYNAGMDGRDGNYGGYRGSNDDRYLPNLLPTLAYNAALELEENTEAPWPLIVSCMLGAMSLAVQPLYNVCFGEGRPQIPCSLYLVTLAESGVGKTSVSDPVVAVFRRHDKEANERFEAEMETFSLDEKIWKEAEKGYLRRVSKLAEKGQPVDDIKILLKEHRREKPVEPQNTRVLFTDVTPEKFLYELRGKRKSAGLWADEGGTIFNGRVLNNLAAINKCWESNFEQTIERKTVPKFTIDDPRVVMSVFVQPKVFENYLERCVRNNSAPMESGFLPRCLITTAVPHLVRRYNQKSATWDRLNRFTGILDKLLARYAAKPGCERQELILSAEARNVLARYGRFIKREKMRTGRYRDIKATASRATNNAVRIAAIFHVIDGEESNIIAAIQMERATDLVNWYMEQSRDLFSGDARVRDDAVVLNQYLQKYWGNFPVPWSEILRGGPYRLRNKNGSKADRMQRAMDLLVDEGRYVRYLGSPRTLMIDLPSRY